MLATERTDNNTPIPIIRISSHKPLQNVLLCVSLVNPHWSLSSTRLQSSDSPDSIPQDENYRNRHLPVAATCSHSTPSNLHKSFNAIPWMLLNPPNNIKPSSPQFTTEYPCRGNGLVAVSVPSTSMLRVKWDFWLQSSAPYPAWHRHDSVSCNEGKK